MPFLFLSKLFNNNTSYVKEGMDSVETDNYANKILGFYYYIPDKLLQHKEKAAHILVCIPGLGGNGRQFARKEFKEFCEKHCFILLAPCFNFDKEYLQEGKSYQYPAVWSGNALLSMITNFHQQGYKTDKLFLFSFSAGAQFSLRFSLWQPSLCLACAAHGSGGKIVPYKSNAVKYFISVGQKDEPRIDNASIFVQQGLNLNMHIEFKTYDCGHRLIKDQVDDSISFFENIIQQISS